MVPSGSEVMLKDTDAVCRRAIAALLSKQIALDISKQAFDHVRFFIDLNEEIVFERRCGLKWLISDRENWNDVPLKYVREHIYGHPGKNPFLPGCFYYNFCKKI